MSPSGYDASRVIEALLKEQDVQVQVVAARAGMRAGEVSSHRHGKRVGQEVEAKLAKGFGVTVSEFRERAGVEIPAEALDLVAPLLEELRGEARNRRGHALVEILELLTRRLELVETRVGLRGAPPMWEHR